MPAISIGDKMKIMADLWTRSQQRYVSLVQLYFLLNMAWLGLLGFLRAEHVSSTFYYYVWWLLSMLICAQMIVALTAAREEGGYFGWALQALEMELSDNGGRNTNSAGFMGCEGQYIMTKTLFNGLALLHGMRRGSDLCYSSRYVKFTKGWGLSLRNAWFFQRLALTPWFFAIVHTACLVYSVQHSFTPSGMIEIIVS